MDDTSERERALLPLETDVVVRVEADEAASAGLDNRSVLQLVEERLSVSARRVAAGTVRLATHTDLHEEQVEVELERYRVEVTRVPVGRIVDAAPSARAEGDTTIVPVIEERFVVVKQLFLTEELHIRHVVERDVVTTPVTLRRQRVTVERLDGAGNPLPEPI